MAGDRAFTLPELANEVSRQARKPVSYKNLSPEEYKTALLGFGMPAAVADMLADSDLGASRGELDSSSDDLRRLIGRPTTTLADAIAGALANA